VTTAIIADDEINLAQHLGDQLQQVWPELELLGTAHNGVDALALIARTTPDIAFLDIRMPGLTGLEVARSVPAGTRVVFVTAYDQYAVDAFVAAATDYLLKPVSEERLRHCINRFTDQPPLNADRLAELLVRLTTHNTPEWLQWLRVGHGDTTRLIAVDDVLYFQSDTKYTTVVTTEREQVVRMSITQLEDQLDPQHFWRVHRAIIVNVRAIIEAKRDLRGRYALKIRGRGEELRTSEAYAHLFRHM
jgi:DNA-binding LytR/AlgR family response regulator